MLLRSTKTQTPEINFYVPPSTLYGAMSGASEKCAFCLLLTMITCAAKRAQCK